MKKIPLNGKNGKGKFVLVDDEDYEYLNQFRWYANSKGYAYRRTKVIFMHREIVNPKEGMVVDHKNGDKLDNQRLNLREATNSQNGVNKFGGTNKTGYRGVSRAGNKYGAIVRVNGKRKWFGGFDTPQEAHELWKEKSKEYWGEFVERWSN